jgi:hypothetical protein
VHGRGIAVRTDLLDGKRVTTFKGAFPAMKQWRPEVQWVHSAQVGRGGEYLDELGGVCGHGSDVLCLSRLVTGRM